MSSCRRRPLRGLDWNWRRRRRLWTPWRRASSRRWAGRGPGRGGGRRAAPAAVGGGLGGGMGGPGPALAGRTLPDIGFRDRYGLTVLAVWREGRPIRTRFADIPLRAGDGLLIQGPRKALTTLGSERDLIVFDAESPWPDREDRRTYALLAVAALIVLTLAGVPVAVAATLAAGIMITSGGPATAEGYRAIDWRSPGRVGPMGPGGGAL